MAPTVKAVAIAPAAFSRNGDASVSAAEPEEEDIDLCDHSIDQLNAIGRLLPRNSTVAERPAGLRALPARRAERNTDLANIVADVARENTQQRKGHERRGVGYNRESLLGEEGGDASRMLKHHFCLHLIRSLKLLARAQSARGMEKSNISILDAIAYSRLHTCCSSHSHP